MRGAGPGVCGATGCHDEISAAVGQCGAWELLSSAEAVVHRRDTTSIQFHVHTEAFDEVEERARSRSYLQAKCLREYSEFRRTMKLTTTV